MKTNPKPTPKPVAKKRTHPWRVFDTGYFARRSKHQALPNSQFRVMPK